MFSIKNEPSDGFDVSNESQRSRLRDFKSNISDALDVNTSEIRPDKHLSKEMLLTVAHVKNESTSNELDFKTSNSKGNEGIHRQHLIDIHDTKTEKKEACTDNTSRQATGKTLATIHVEEESQLFREHDINSITDISQHHRVCESDEIDIGDICPSSATQSRYETHECIEKKST